MMRRFVWIVLFLSIGLAWLAVEPAGAQSQPPSTTASTLVTLGDPALGGAPASTLPAVDHQQGIAEIEQRLAADRGSAESAPSTVTNDASPGAPIAPVLVAAALVLIAIAVWPRRPKAPRSW